MRNFSSLGCGTMNVFSALSLGADTPLEYLGVQNRVWVDAFNLCFVAEGGAVKGDEKIISIAAASIVAKVARDLFMIKLAKKYPKYCWNKNFGYGTSDHMYGLKKYGVTKHHRKKFKPIHKMLMNKTRETQ